MITEFPEIKSQLQPVIGTHDILPEEFDHYEEIKTKLKEHFILSGYRGIETPVLDYTSLHTKKAGDEITAKMYNFEDPGHNHICLRPELTASVVRAYINNLQSLKKPIKLFYIGPAFRYDRPQKGRYRQFNHAGVELIGPGTTLSEAEIIYLACQGLNKLGLKNYQAKVSHLGIIFSFFDSLGLNEQVKSFLINSLEDLGKKTKELVDIGNILSQMGEKGSHIDKALAFLHDLLQLRGSYPQIFTRIEELLSKYQLPSNQVLEELKQTLMILSYYQLDQKRLEVDFGFGRGLQYYTGLIFELHYPGLGAQSQICGGGRYDHLIELLGGSPWPALGFAYGLERVQMSLEVEHLLPKALKSPLMVFIIPYNNSVYDYCLTILTQLHQAGIKAGLDIMGKSIRKNLDDVNQDKIPFAMVIGPDEKEKQIVNLRNMTEGKEIKIAWHEFDKLISILKG